MPRPLRPVEPLVGRHEPGDHRRDQLARIGRRGIPGSAPGDFYAVLQIVVPPADTESARVLYNGMAEQFKSFDPRSMPGA